jgi:hypothetical protein
MKLFLNTVLGLSPTILQATVSAKIPAVTPSTFIGDLF